jgi:hypothetical protein
MKKFNLFIVIFFIAIVSLQAEDLEKNTVVVFEPTSEIFKELQDRSSQAAKTHIRKEISRIVGANNDSYTLVEWSKIEELIEIMITEGTAIFDQSTCMKIGKMSGATKVIMTDIIRSTDGFFRIYCEQLDVATAIVEKQGEGMIYCWNYIYLAAGQAASVFAKNPEELLKKIEADKERYCVTPSPPPPPPPLSTFRVKTAHGNSGLSVSYEQRNRELKNMEPESIKNLNYWDQELMQGIQVGFHFDKYFAPKIFGLGVHTGIYAGYYSLEGKLLSDGNDHLSFQDIRLYVPLQGIYRFDFSENIGCFVTCGLSADLGLYSRIRLKNGKGIRVHNNIYDKAEWDNIKRLNYSLTYGVGFQVSRLIFNVSADKGLLNQSDDTSFRIFENRKLRLGLTLMF